MLSRLLTPWRIKWCSVSILFARVLGFMVCVFSGSGSTTISGRLGADYPAFYAAGRMVSNGQLRQIYNPELQAAEQKYLMGNDIGYLPFGYPPFVALFYWPLSLLPYRLSYAFHTFLMVVALLFTLRVIRPMSKATNRNFIGAVTLSICFFPIFKSITGGQNTVITMLLLALSWRALAMQREYGAGVFCGLMLFKPQFALPLIGVFLLSGRWRVGVSSGIVAIILYLIGTFMIGPDWIMVWLDKAQWQVQLYADLDKLNAVSWLGFFEAVFGAGNQWALIMGWALTLLTIIGVSWIWWRGDREAALTAKIGLISICLVLIPPHVMFYDMGVLLFAYIAIAAKPIQWNIGILMTISIFSWTQPLLASKIGFSPLFLVTVATFAIVAVTLVPQALKINNKGLIFKENGRI